MLSEGFLSVLNYRDAETKSKSTRTEADSECTSVKSRPNVTGVQRKARVQYEGAAGLLIPGHPLTPPPDPVLMDCSLLEHYPDLQVADSGPIPAPKSTTPQPTMSPPVNVPVQPGQDQGYLVMGDSVNVSADVPELRTNSVLNGMLEKKLEEVYLQHLTENLARCNSNAGNSILHGLVPPPRPNRRGTDSLMVSVEEAPASSDKTISYLHTGNAGTCSSHFSSPVLRISAHLSD